MHRICQDEVWNDGKEALPGQGCLASSAELLQRVSPTAHKVGPCQKNMDHMQQRARKDLHPLFHFAPLLAVEAIVEAV
jgi:hypothetical protein